MLGAPGTFDAGQVADALIGGLVEILLALVGSKLFQLVVWTVGGFVGFLLVYWFAVSFRSLVYVRRRGGSCWWMVLRVIDGK